MKSRSIALLLALALLMTVAACGLAEGSERTLLMAMPADDPNEETLNVYDNGIIVISESSPYATEVGWEMGENDVLNILVSEGLKGFLTMEAENANGEVIITMESMGGNNIYRYPLADYKAIFGLDPAITGTVEQDGNTLAIYDIGTFEMTIDGETTQGTVVYTASENGGKAALTLVSEDGNEIVATTGTYDNNFNILDKFVIADGEMRHFLNYGVAIYNEGDMTLYFFRENALSLIFHSDDEVTEFPCTYAFDNADLENLVLEISCPVPAIYGGPEITVEYSGDDDEFTITVKRGEEETELILDGTMVNDDLGSYVSPAILAELVPVYAAVASGDEIDANQFVLQFIAGGGLKLIMHNEYTKSDLELGSSSWQYSDAEGMGYALSGAYIAGAFTHGGLADDNLTLTVNLSGMQSVSVVRFELTSEEWAAVKDALK